MALSLELRQLIELLRNCTQLCKYLSGNMQNFCFMKRLSNYSFASLHYFICLLIDFIVVSTSLHYFIHLLIDFIIVSTSLHYFIHLLIDFIVVNTASH